MPYCRGVVPVGSKVRSQDQNRQSTNAVTVLTCDVTSVVIVTITNLFHVSLDHSTPPETQSDMPHKSRISQAEADYFAQIRKEVGAFKEVMASADLMWLRAIFERKSDQARRAHAAASASTKLRASSKSSRVRDVLEDLSEDEAEEGKRYAREIRRLERDWESIKDLFEEKLEGAEDIIDAFEARLKKEARARRKKGDHDGKSDRSALRALEADYGKALEDARVEGRKRQKEEDRRKNEESLRKAAEARAAEADFRFALLTATLDHLEEQRRDAEQRATRAESDLQRLKHLDKLFKTLSEQRNTSYSSRTGVNVDTPFQENRSSNTGTTRDAPEGRKSPQADKENTRTSENRPPKPTQDAGKRRRVEERRRAEEQKAREEAKVSKAEAQRQRNRAEAEKARAEEAEERARRAEEALQQEERKLKTEREEVERLREELREEKLRHAEELQKCKEQNAWKRYEAVWAVLGDPLPFGTIPWPTMETLEGPENITLANIRSFLFAESHSVGQSKRDRVKKALLRWHPDKFGPKIARVPEAERDAVQEGVGLVARYLNDLMHEK